MSYLELYLLGCAIAFGMLLGRGDKLSDSERLSNAMVFFGLSWIIIGYFWSEHE